MQPKYFKRIDDSLVEDMEEPELRDEYTEQDLMYNQDVLVEWQSRPSYLINPADLDKFNTVDRYEENVHFETDYDYTEGTGGKLYAFAIPKANDEGQDERVPVWLSKKEWMDFKESGSKRLLIEFGGGIGNIVRYESSPNRWIEITDYESW
jgi:hypothetical protein